MTAVQQMLKELQEKFPKQMADMYESNQLLLEDIALKAKKMEKEQIAKALIRGHNDCGVFTMQSECDEYYKQTFKSE